MAAEGPSRQSGSTSDSFPLLCVVPNPSHPVSFKIRGSLAADSRLRSFCGGPSLSLKIISDSPLSSQLRFFFQIDFCFLSFKRTFVTFSGSLSFPQHCGLVSSWTEFNTWPVRNGSVPSSSLRTESYCALQVCIQSLNMLACVFVFLCCHLVLLSEDFLTSPKIPHVIVSVSSPRADCKVVQTQSSWDTLSGVHAGA